MPGPGSLETRPHHHHGTEGTPSPKASREARREVPADATARAGRVPEGRRDAGLAAYDLAWEMAVELFEQAGGDSVRAIEGLAAALTNRLRRRLDRGVAASSAHARGRAPRRRDRPEPIASASRPPAPLAATLSAEAERRFQVCRRIARRSLVGSLPDPTGGATAFHRVGEYPSWAADLLPVAEIGPFLFYRPG